MNKKNYNSINNTISLVKDRVKSINFLLELIIKNFKEQEYLTTIYDLNLLRDYIISEETKPTIFHINFINFIDDESMWKFLRKIEKQNKFDKKDIVGLNYVMADLMERVEKSEIFENHCLTSPL